MDALQGTSIGDGGIRAKASMSRGGAGIHEDQAWGAWRKVSFGSEYARFSRDEVVSEVLLR